MKDRLVTLIGGGGFAGRYVAQALMRAGARVRIAQRDPREAFYIKPLGGLGQTQFVAADVTRPETIARAVADSDAVVNLVGTLKGDFQAIHVAGARTVAEAAAAAGAQALVHFSALGANRESPSAYGRTKAAGEQAVLEAFPGATILRPSFLFGQEDAFVNRFAAMIASAPLGVVPLIRADVKMQPVFVADVADAVVAALADPAKLGGEHELGGPDVMTMAELFRWIARELGRAPAFAELPDAFGALIAALPGTPITRDQWNMLARDNVVAQEAQGLGAFGVRATPLAAVAPAWLVLYRKHGRFGSLSQSA